MNDDEDAQRRLATVRDCVSPPQHGHTYLQTPGLLGVAVCGRLVQIALLLSLAALSMPTALVAFPWALAGTVHPLLNKALLWHGCGTRGWCLGGQIVVL